MLNRNVNENVNEYSNKKFNFDEYKPLLNNIDKINKDNKDDIINNIEKENEKIKFSSIKFINDQINKFIKKVNDKYNIFHLLDFDFKRYIYKIPKTNDKELIKFIIKHNVYIHKTINKLNNNNVIVHKINKIDIDYLNALFNKINTEIKYFKCDSKKGKYFFECALNQIINKYNQNLKENEVFYIPINKYTNKILCCLYHSRTGKSTKNVRYFIMGEFNMFFYHSNLKRNIKFHKYNYVRQSKYLYGTKYYFIKKWVDLNNCPICYNKENELIFKHCSCVYCGVLICDECCTTIINLNDKNYVCPFCKIEYDE